MREQSAAQLAALKEQAESQDGLKSLLEGQNEQFMDYVHKENVKVYRNVQASVMEELKAILIAHAKRYPGLWIAHLSGAF